MTSTSGKSVTLSVIIPVRNKAPFIDRCLCSVFAAKQGNPDVEIILVENRSTDGTLALLRPGGTVCGPAMMGLADVTLYGVVLSLIGAVELTVTTDLSFHFLTKPRPADLLARGRILRLGRSLAVGEVTVFSEGADRPVAHCVGTYAIPA